MAVKCAKRGYSTANCGIHYKCPGLGEQLVEVRNARRQKVVIIPAFLNKYPEGTVITMMASSSQLGPGNNKSYGYSFNVGLISPHDFTTRWEKGKFPKPTHTLPDKPSRFPVLGNYTSLVVVKDNNKKELCRYFICGRFMGNDQEGLIREMLKQPDRFSTHLISGAKKYLPKAIPRGKDLKGHDGWVTDGYYYESLKGSLFIEPYPTQTFPTLKEKCARTNHIEISGVKGQYSIPASVDHTRIYFNGVRSICGLHKKVYVDSYHNLDEE